MSIHIKTITYIELTLYTKSGGGSVSYPPATSVDANGTKEIGHTARLIRAGNNPHLSALIKRLIDPYKAGK
jgi:hypothetical protein